MTDCWQRQPFAGSRAGCAGPMRPWPLALSLGPLLRAVYVAVTLRNEAMSPLIPNPKQNAGLNHCFLQNGWIPNIQRFSLGCRCRHPSKPTESSMGTESKGTNRLTPHCPPHWVTGPWSLTQERMCSVSIQETNKKTHKLTRSKTKPQTQVLLSSYHREHRKWQTHDLSTGSCWLKLLWSTKQGMELYPTDSHWDSKNSILWSLRNR